MNLSSSCGVGLVEEEVMNEDNGVRAATAEAIDHIATLETRLAHMTEAAGKMREALEAISDGHLPDQPATSALDEREWAVQHIRRLRAIARTALEAYEASHAD